jgi:hypothetical protein
MITNSLVIIVGGKGYDKIIQPANINYGCVIFNNKTIKDCQIRLFNNNNEKKFLIRKFNRKIIEATGKKQKCTINLYYGMNINDYLSQEAKQ